MVNIMYRPMTGLERAVMYRNARPGLITRLLRRLLKPTDAIEPTAEDYKRDYEESDIERLEIVSCAFATGDEWGDECPIYFIDPGDGEFLHLCGKWLLYSFVVTDVDVLVSRSERGPKWFKAFQLERARFSGHVFSITGDTTEL